MLILPPGHAAGAPAMRRLTAREKRLIGGVLAVVAVLVVSVVIALATTSPSSGSGCLHLTVAGPVGAGEINECGVAARNTCADVLKPGAFVPAARGEVVAACRKARLPVG